MSYNYGFLILLLAHTLNGEDAACPDTDASCSIPLQWKFQEMPVACASGGACAQASLNDNSSLMFDGNSGSTWIFGTVNNQTWNHIINSNSPTKRFDHKMASLGDDRVVLFGGKNTAGEYFDDTWIFYNTKQKWEQIKTIISPGKRYRHVMGSLGEKVVLFGGENEAKEFLNDTWTFKSQWKQINTYSTTNKPKPRTSSSMASLENGQVLLYGGYNGNIVTKHFSDTWLYDDSTSKWIQIDTSNTPSPTMRDRSAMASLGDGSILLFGGYNGAAHQYDSWIFNKNTKWTWLNINKASSPPARDDHTMAKVGNKIVLFGGYDGAKRLTHDTWLFTDNTKSWTKVTIPLFKAPDKRSQHAMAPLGRDNIIMFGGDIGSNNKYFDDTWLIDHTMAWTQIKSSTSPSGRDSIAMASLGDSIGKILLFGGFNGTHLSDTWLFDKATHEWTETKTAISPKHRDRHKMVPLKEGTVFLFGGYNYIDLWFGDSWIFYYSTSKWQQIDSSSTSISPATRDNHGMASLGNGMAVLFGGHSGNVIAMRDTWVFEQSTDQWTQVIFPSQTKIPCKRYNHAMTTLGDNKAVLYAGYDHTGTFLDDTWLFHTGTDKKWTWTKLATQMDGRRYSAMTFSFQSGIFLFGGLTKYQIGTSLTVVRSQDTWTLANGCPIGYGGVGCAVCPKGYYKNNTLNIPCTPCPSKTTTGEPGAVTINECLICDGSNIQTKNGTCFVDILNNFATEWTCFGTWGPRCKNPCPGGSILPCQGNGVCQSGPKGSGNCTCDTYHFGDTCENRCKEYCNYQGTCNKLLKGTTMTCSCNFLFVGPFSSTCAFPFVLLIIILVSLLVPSVIYFIIVRCNKRRKEDAEDHEIELEIRDDIYRLLEDDLEESKIDNSKLQQARIIKLTDIKLAEVIGKGAFGEVRKGRWRGIDVAVKKMFPEEMEKFGYDIMLSNKSTTSTESTTSTSSTYGLNEIAKTMLGNLEIGVMMRLNHPRIVAFLGAGEIVDPPLEGDDVPRVGIFVMLEYAAGGDLIHRLQAAAGSVKIFPWSDRIQCAMDVAEGMQYIHSQGFLHRDLKSLNVLCDARGRCMIADLGLVCSNIRPDLSNKPEDYEDYQKIDKYKSAKSIQYNHHTPFAGDTNFNTTWQGTAGWMAPEAMGKNNYGFKADVYSFGIVMYELLTCRIPWAGSGYNFTHLIKDAVMRGERPKIKKRDLMEAPDDFVKLMKICWDVDPKKRPTFDELFLELKNAFKLCQNHGNGNGKNKINITIPRDQPSQNKETKSNEYLTASDGTVFTLPSAK